MNLWELYNIWKNSGLGYYCRINIASNNLFWQVFQTHNLILNL